MGQDVYGNFGSYAYTPTDPWLDKVMECFSHATHPAYPRQARELILSLPPVLAGAFCGMLMLAKNKDDCSAAVDMINAATAIPPNWESKESVDKFIEFIYGHFARKEERTRLCSMQDWDGIKAIGPYLETRKITMDILNGNHAVGVKPAVKPDRADGVPNPQGLALKLEKKKTLEKLADIFNGL